MAVPRPQLEEALVSALRRINDLTFQLSRKSPARWAYMQDVAVFDVAEAREDVVAAQDAAVNAAKKIEQVRLPPRRYCA